MICTRPPPLLRHVQPARTAERSAEPRSDRPGPIPALRERAAHLMTWLKLADDTGFGISNLPFGIYSTPGTQPRTGVAIGDQILDVTAVTGDSLHATGTLNAFMARGRTAWIGVRRQLVGWLTDEVNAARGSDAF